MLLLLNGTIHTHKNQFWNNSPEERDEEGGGRYAGGWRICVGELGGAATLEREPPNRRLKSATRPLDDPFCCPVAELLMLLILVILPAAALFWCWLADDVVKLLSDDRPLVADVSIDFRWTPTFKGGAGVCCEPAAGLAQSVPISDGSTWGPLLQEKRCKWGGPRAAMGVDRWFDCPADKAEQRKSDVLLYKPHEWRPALLLLLLLMMLLLLLMLFVVVPPGDDVCCWVADWLLLRHRLPRMGVVLAEETTGRQAIGLITPWPWQYNNNTKKTRFQLLFSFDLFKNNNAADGLIDFHHHQDSFTFHNFR